MKRITLLLSVLLLLSLLGCGKKEVSSSAPAPNVTPTQAVTEAPVETEPAPTERKEEIKEEEAPIPTETTPLVMTAPALGEGPDGPKVMIFTDYYTIDLPKEWESTCLYKVYPLEHGAYSTAIYEHDSLIEFGGGKLCTLMMIPTDDDTYKDFPDYELLCALDTPAGSFYVVALFPTDVQFSENTADTYNAMFEELMDVLWTIHPNNGIEMAMP